MKGGQTLEQGTTGVISILGESKHLTKEGPKQPYLVTLALSKELDLTTSRSSFQTKLFWDSERAQLIQPSKPEPEFVPPWKNPKHNWSRRATKAKG